MGSGVRRIILLTLGWEDLPKAVSVHGTPKDVRLREPVPGVLLECDGGWMLLDTGFNTALIRDPRCISGSIQASNTCRCS
jgi:N-acyl homoserine lactone hydrolase